MCGSVLQGNFLFGLTSFLYMNKLTGLSAAILSLISGAAAHLSHSSGSMPRQGFHATTWELAFIVVLALLIVGMVYYGFTRADEPEEYTGGE